MSLRCDANRVVLGSQKITPLWPWADYYQVSATSKRKKNKKDKRLSIPHNAKGCKCTTFKVYWRPDLYEVNELHNAWKEVQFLTTIYLFSIILDPHNYFLRKQSPEYHSLLSNMKTKLAKNRCLKEISPFQGVGHSFRAIIAISF